MLICFRQFSGRRFERILFRRRNRVFQENIVILKNDYFICRKIFTSAMELIGRLEFFVSFDGDREIFNFSFPFVSEVELESARDRDSRFSSASRRVFFEGFGGYRKFDYLIFFRSFCYRCFVE